MDDRNAVFAEHLMSRTLKNTAADMPAALDKAAAAHGVPFKISPSDLAANFSRRLHRAPIGLVVLRAPWRKHLNVRLALLGLQVVDYEQSEYPHMIVVDVATPQQIADAARRIQEPEFTQ